MIMYAVGKPGGALIFRSNRDLITLADGEFMLAVDDLPDGDVTFNGDGTALIAVEMTGEAAMVEVRTERNRRLSVSDWTQGRDAPLTDQQIAAWATYRQALRDLPEQHPAATIDTVAWPAQPAS